MRKRRVRRGEVCGGGGGGGSEKERKGWPGWGGAGVWEWVNLQAKLQTVVYNITSFRRQVPESGVRSVPPSTGLRHLEEGAGKRCSECVGVGCGVGLGYYNRMMCAIRHQENVSEK